MEPSRTIAILTDFGLTDHYVGVLKGVISSISPHANIIDVTHEIPPGDIQRAAVTLWQARPYFPPGTIFLCVVDPGVGTARRAVIIESGHNCYIGPDNGIFSFVLEPDYRVHEITNSEYFLPNPSSTFHGRDIFAPAAAHISLGIEPSNLGQAVKKLIQNLDPLLEYLPPDMIRGQILQADRFGNLLTSIGSFYHQEDDTLLFDPWLSVHGKNAQQTKMRSNFINIEVSEGKILPLVENFSQLTQGSCGALIGSSRLIEIVANNESASRLLGLVRGEVIHLRMS